MISTQFEAVRNRLVQEMSINIKPDWLVDCVNYFLQNDPSISIDNLFNGTIEQLLLTHYAHACDPVIPNELRTVTTIWTLKENLFLQMQFLVDICEYFKMPLLN
jgi:hypothetical protein